MQRYHPVLVALHWLMALMVLIALTAGSLILANMANDDPDKILALTGHMSAGMVMGALLVVRFVTRLLSVLALSDGAALGLFDGVRFGGSVVGGHVVSRAVEGPCVFSTPLGSSG